MSVIVRVTGNAQNAPVAVLTRLLMRAAVSK